jgi:hypothetical protein
MNMKYLALVAGAAIAAHVLPGALRGARAQGVQLQGTYELVPAQSDDVAAAIRATTADMNFIERPIARSRLRKVSAPYQRLRIMQSATETVMIFDDESPVHMPADGSAAGWRHRGELMQVSGGWQGERLVQNFQAEDGKRVNTYVRADDGNQLRLEVVLTSPRMRKPMKYSLVYRRADES